MKLQCCLNRARKRQLHGLRVEVRDPDPESKLSNMDTVPAAYLPY
jgi:hypothetical protein